MSYCRGSAVASSLVVFDISVVAGAGSYGPDCSDVHTWPTSWLCFSCRSHWCRSCFGLVFPQFLVQARFLSCSTSSSTLSGSGCSSRSTGTPDVSASCADDCHMLMVCFKSSFLWSSIIASMIFAVMDFFSAKDSKVSAIMVSFGGVQAGVLVVWFATDISMP